MSRTISHLRSLSFGAAEEPLTEPRKGQLSGLRDGGSLVGDFARAVAIECGADDIFVARHGDECAPVPLFFARCPVTSDAIQRELLTAPADDATGGSGREPAWRTVTLPDRTVGVVTTSISAVGAVRITVTVIFEAIGETTCVRARKVASRLAPLLSAFFRLWQLQDLPPDPAQAIIWNGDL